MNTDDIFGYNLFAYCGNNPINRCDPNGMDAIILYDDTKGIYEHLGALIQISESEWQYFYWGQDDSVKESPWALITGAKVKTEFSAPFTLSDPHDLSAINTAVNRDFNKMQYLEGDFSDSINYKLPEEYRLLGGTCSNVTLKMLSSSTTNYSKALKNASKHIHPLAGYYSAKINVSITNKTSTIISHVTNMIKKVFTR